MADCPVHPTIVKPKRPFTEVRLQIKDDFDIIGFRRMTEKQDTMLKSLCKLID